MRKALIKYLVAVLPVLLAATLHAQERLYVVTDRSAYIAGEPVFVSAFCMDVAGEKPRLSGLSAIAYLELSSADGRVLGGKIALVEGRGAGRLELPRTLPTGNYRLTAYTAVSQPAPGRMISIYNTLSQARVQGGVEVNDALPAQASRQQEGGLDIRLEKDGSLRLLSPEAASVSVSVFRSRGLPSYGRPSLSQILEQAGNARETGVVPEYDGEQIRLHFTSPDGSPYPVADSMEVFIGRPGRAGDLYSSYLGADGEVVLYTCNYFGKGDLVVSLPAGAPAFRVQVTSPFRELPAGDIPALALSPSMARELQEMSVHMQASAAFDADTLYERLPVRALPFVGDEAIRYVLDDYTRFATMQEVFVEYLSDIRARKKGKDVQLQVRCNDNFKGRPYFSDMLPSLILVDGVPVMDHALVYEMDPSLVKEIDVYPYRYAPNMVYSGVANFITFKGDMSQLKLGQNVRVLDFEGCSWPQALGPIQNARYPFHMRETLLWQPVVELQAGEALSPPAIPEGTGAVTVVVEGITRTGQAIFSCMEVKL